VELNRPLALSADLSVCGAGGLSLSSVGYFLIGAFIVIGVVVVQSRRDRPKSQTESNQPAPVTDSLREPERAARMRRQILEHRGEYLRYQLWQEGVRCDLSKEKMAELLGDGPEILAAPVLYLHFNDTGFSWRRQELVDAVAKALTELEMALPDGFSDPTDRACESCRIWARAEALKQSDGL
jgi:hypothetical protein